MLLLYIVGFPVDKLKPEEVLPSSTRISILLCRYHSTSAPHWARCYSGNKDKWPKYL